MKEPLSGLSRRALLKTTGTVVGGLVTAPVWGLIGDQKSQIDRIKDPVIRAGVLAAVNKNLIPAATESAYPGFFNISADGGAYGGEATWPGLDSWQMAGAYLLIGRHRLVLDYFDFVRASQRKDGNVPFAIFTGDTQPGDTYLRGMKVPDDIFTYVPPKRDGVPPSSQQTRKWVGLFTHWELKSNPLSTLGPICYILTAAEIFDATHDSAWLKDHLPSIEGAAQFVYSLITTNGLVGGSGFYTELPPREGWDGVTQCYAIHAFRELARLKRANLWSSRADALAKALVKEFWRDDHFGEYVHITHGLVDSHGLSDTNWAAVAFGIADSRHLKVLWPKLIHEPAFWLGGMPTQTVTKPFAYEAWENDLVPFATPPPTHDVAAMGRAWYLEALACKRMHATERLVESTRLVCRMAKDGYWRERYNPKADGTAEPTGAEKYCEYAAVLARVVLGNPDVFCR